MTELVNALYFIEKTGFDSSWARKLLTERLEYHGVKDRYRQYIKEEVDEIIDEYKMAKVPKQAYEWEISDISEHFGICYTFAQRLCKCDGWPEPNRRIAGEKPSNLKRVWLIEDIKKQNIKDYPEVWVREKAKKKRKPKLTTIEQQFLRGFRL